MFKPEFNLALSALAIATPQQPSAIDVQAQIVGTTDSAIVRQYPQCSAEDSQTEWVVQVGNKFITYKLGNLSEQCGNGPIDNPGIGGLAFEMGRFITAGERVFDLETTKILPAVEGNRLSCPEGFTGFELVNTNPSSSVSLLPAKGELNSDNTITTRLSLDLRDPSKFREFPSGNFIQNCVDALGNSVAFKKVDYRLITPFIGKIDLKVLTRRFTDRFNQSFGSTKGQPNYDQALDYDENEIVNLADLSLFAAPDSLAEEPGVRLSEIAGIQRLAFHTSLEIGNADTAIGVRYYDQFDCLKEPHRTDSPLVIEIEGSNLTSDLGIQVRTLTKGVNEKIIQSAYAATGTSGDVKIRIENSFKDVVSGNEMTLKYGQDNSIQVLVNRVKQTPAGIESEEMISAGNTISYSCLSK